MTELTPIRKLPLPPADARWISRLSPVVLDAFSSNDFHKVDMRKIADEAGMSLATIYRYYGDKEGLLFAFVEVWLADLGGRVDQALLGLESPREKIRKTLWVHLDYYERNPKVGRVIFLTVPMQTWITTERFGRREFALSLMGVIKDGQRDGSINADLPVQITLDFIVGGFARAFIMWQYRGCQTSLTSQFNPMFQILWLGLEART